MCVCVCVCVCVCAHACVCLAMVLILYSFTSSPGVKFSLHCVNHLLLPMLQSWLRRGSRLPGYWDTGAVNFKQCCGLTADLVVEFIAKFVGEVTFRACCVQSAKRVGGWMGEVFECTFVWGVGWEGGGGGYVHACL